MEVKGIHGISVVICCFNSKDRLPETLVHLANQKVSGQRPWEIIIVDNASTDDAAVNAMNYWSAEGVPSVKMKIANQPLKGLMHAREKGIEVSSFNLIIFCDDDNHLSLDYIDQAGSLMEQRKDVCIAGGYIKPKFLIQPGEWMADFYAALAISRHSKKDDFVDWVFGAGMVIRRSIFDELKKRGIQFILVGRKGEKQTFGEDAEICLLTRFLGHKIYYSESLKLEHEISAHRLQRKHFLHANYRNVFPLVVLFLMERLIGNNGLTEKKLYYEKLKNSVSMIFFFIPRCFFGGHQFYSFILLFQNFQLMLWLVFRRSEFSNVFLMIKKEMA